MKVDIIFFFFKQKTAYEIGTGDWSSDVSLPISYSISGYICVPYFFTVNKKECDDYPGEEVPEDDAEEVMRRRQRNKPAKLRDYRSGK